MMGMSKGAAKSKGKTLGKWFPVLSSVASQVLKDSRSAARMETVEILADLEQVTTLFSSMEDWRAGQIVSMDTAFGDL